MKSNLLLRPLASSFFLSALNQIFCVSLVTLSFILASPGLVRAEENPPQEAEAQKASYVQFEDAFKAGIAAYQAKNYKSASEAFSAAVQFEPESAQALSNLALAQYQIGEKGWAIANLRKALNLSPGFSTPKHALSFILKESPVKEIPHQIEFSENLRTLILLPVPLEIYLLSLAIFGFASLWFLLSYLGKRKRALQHEQSLPPLPWGNILSLGFCCILLYLTILKIADSQTSRATIVAEKVEALSAPQPDSPSLFELYSGLEVKIRGIEKDWVQVTYPGGPTGWVPKSSLFLTSGSSKW